MICTQTVAYNIIYPFLIRTVQFVNYNVCFQHNYLEQPYFKCSVTYVHFV